MPVIAFTADAVSSMFFPVPHWISKDKRRAKIVLKMNETEEFFLQVVD